MIEIKDIKISLGSKLEQNSMLEKQLNLKKGSIYKLTGIKKRYIAEKNETSESLAIKACKQIKVKDIKKISHIISVTNTQKNRFPGISNIISEFFQITDVHCINLNQGCTGYVDAMQIASNILRENKKFNILIVTSDTYSKFINKKNKSVRCLFSDGASASIIKYKKNGFEIKKNTYKNILKSSKDLHMSGNEINMNGPAVVSFSLKYVLPEVKKLNNNFNCLISHQAGGIILNQFKKAILKKTFFPTNYNLYGNLVSTSIPNLMKEHFSKIKKQKKILMCGFGVGLSVSMILLKKNNFR